MTTTRRRPRAPRGRRLALSALLVGTLAAIGSLVGDQLWEGATAGGDDRVVGSRPRGTTDGMAVAALSIGSTGDFLNSVGVNVHWDYPDTPYGYDYERTKELLVDSGIRHVRGEPSRAADLADQGIRTTVLVDQDVDGLGTPAQIVGALRPLAVAGAVVAVEGPNEGDKSWVERDRTYEGESFPEAVQAWQEDLWRAVKQDPLTQHLVVIGPSLGVTYWDGGNPFGKGSLRDVVDWGNFHPYAAGNPFTDSATYAGVDAYYRHADFPSVALDEHPINFTTYRPPFGDKPMAATEAGYSTWHLGQSEEVQAAYIPRLFLEHFRLGMPRTFSYEFVDESDDPAGVVREANFGLVRHDLTPKPAYRALQSLLETVEGVEGTVEVQGDEEDSPAFSLRISAPPGYDAAALHHVVLTRDDGSAVVAVWHEVSADDLSGLDADPPRPLRQLIHPPMSVALNISGRAGGVIVQEISTDGSLARTPTERVGDTWLFDVPDRVVLVSVAPVD